MPLLLLLFFLGAINETLTNVFVGVSVGIHNVRRGQDVVRVAQKRWLLPVQLAVQLAVHEMMAVFKS